MLKEYVLLFRALWDCVTLFYRDRQLFVKCATYFKYLYIGNSVGLKNLRIDERLLSEEFLTGKPYSYEKLAEITVDRDGNVNGHRPFEPNDVR